MARSGRGARFRVKFPPNDPPLNAFLHLDRRDGSDPRARPWHLEVFPRLAGLRGWKPPRGRTSWR